jgi:D-beta-D-heptose 7-phosphate kinase / D-beta-D-heptose 1-phosphate adenosyltransferase
MWWLFRKKATEDDMASTYLGKQISMFHNIKVLILGEAILDSYLIGHTERLCREAPVPIVDIQDRRDVPGGAAHAAVNVATLGGQSIFLTVLGEDAAGSTLLTALQERGVNTDHIIIDPRHQTLVKQRITSGEHIVVRCDQGSTELIPPDVEQQLLAQLEDLAAECDVILVSDYAYGIITPGIVEALTRLRQRFDGILAIDSKRLSLFQECRPTLIKPSYEQAVDLLHISASKNGMRAIQMAENQAELLRVTGAQIAAVTLDSDGALIFEKGRSAYRTYSQPADHANAVGAGDTYISAFTLALAAGATTRDAADLAACAGQVVVKEPGTTPCSWQALLDHLHQQHGENIKRIIDRQRLAEIVATHRQHQRRIVFTNGCFDILHAGHVKYLAQARELGDVLIVGVNSDASIARLKGSDRPINPLRDRIEVLAALESVDHLISFDEDTPMDLIKIVRPDIFVKGGDYNEDSLPEASLVKELGGRVEIMPYLLDRSTTRLIEAIRHNGHGNGRSSLPRLSFPAVAGNGNAASNYR